MTKICGLIVFCMSLTTVSNGQYLAENPGFETGNGDGWSFLGDYGSLFNISTVSSRVDNNLLPGGLYECGIESTGKSIYYGAAIQYIDPFAKPGNSLCINPGYTVSVWVGSAIYYYSGTIRHQLRWAPGDVRSTLTTGNMFTLGELIAQTYDLGFWINIGGGFEHANDFTVWVASDMITADWAIANLGIDGLLVDRNLCWAVEDWSLY